ncbi:MULTISPECIES: hypothetical protein [Sphingomonas]|jgi:hypothetical protein|uniref:DUF551 domain-containing protein n=1 Tax=Sphingomonas zeae TaxID=1646122 RepID=A0A7Y6EFR2_9SPHN|nr:MULTISPECIES: hypothetical protein [Sphingomonas]MBB4049647.1 hypothetical protein [Sphingomonas zeae]MDK8187840.1 hypothetical protein [Sphingomonas zeae]MDK8217694.1 hypothetical protein [Sphingomonas sp. UMB7805-LC452B]NUU46028.1 hypothetical protein [Sphingomonas zeae]
MTDLTERLRLIAAWRTRGGPTPKQACPSVYETTTEAATTLETLTQENARLREAGWRDAKDAPRDGTRIMLWLREPWSCVELARWYEPWGVWLTERYIPNETDEMGGIGADVPTHWMPLPPAPAKSALEAK